MGPCKPEVRPGARKNDYQPTYRHLSKQEDSESGKFRGRFRHFFVYHGDVHDDNMQLYVLCISMISIRNASTQTFSGANLLDFGTTFLLYACNRVL